MARIAAAGAVFAFLIAGLVTGPEAQGLVTMQCARPRGHRQDPGGDEVGPRA